MVLGNTVSNSVPPSRGFCSPRQTQCAQSIELAVPPLQPQPHIYTPLYELALGNPATWNSPDIVGSWQPILVGGAWQWPYSTAGTEQYATATVSNLSTLTAVNMSVRVSLGAPGISSPSATLSATQTLIITLPGNSKVPITIPLGTGITLIPLGEELFIPPAVFVDLAPTYDSNFNDNHGVLNAWISMLSANSVTAPSAILLVNSAAAPAQFNLAIIGPNPIGATLAQDTYDVPGASSGYVALNFPAQPAGSNAEVTVVGTDGAGGLLGSSTARLYFS